MVFSSATFLFAFLPLALAAHFLVPKRARNAVLLLCSLVFYAWGEPVYICLMLFSILLDYSCGLLAGRFRGRFWGKAALGLSLVGNIGLLAFFKYSGFIGAMVGAAFEAPALPIGISFYTFQTMSYTIDVYRGRVAPQRNILDFGAYVSLFPQLIAGPIVRYTDVAGELRERKVTWEGFGQGAMRFIRGLAKKAILANGIGELWSAASAGGNTSILAAWLGILGFAMQLYFDFSGYSDMAIGLGRMFGFSFPENFDKPYLADSISDFWRRWHKTLGGWFRDYVYFPLGGSRNGRLRTLRNLAVVWLLTGLWHGAAWNFVLWGAYYGFFIILEKLLYGRALAAVPGAWGGALRHGYALLVVLVGWALFACDSVAGAGAYIASMFSGAMADERALYYLSNYGILLAALLAAQLPLGKWLCSRWPEAGQSRWIRAARCAVYTAALGLSIAYIISGGFNPFLYFRF